jgi:hypothetical protein
VTRLKWKLVLERLEIVVILTQYRRTVCAEQAWKTFWRCLMEVLGDVGHVESRFGLFRDSVSVGVR